MPLHFIWGDEDFLIERSIKKITNNILRNDVNELNYRAVDNPNFALFSELLRTNSMMFGPIVIKINCPKYFLESKTKEKLDDKQTQELVNDFKNVNDNVTIILVCPTPKGEKKKPDSRKKIYKELIKVAKVEEFQTFRSYEENKLIPIIKNFSSELDLKIENKECLLLIQITGSYLRDLYTQLEKLKLYAYPKNIVSEAMIKEIASSNFDILKVVDLILENKEVLALKLIDNLLQKEHYLSILAFLQTVISNLLKIKIYSKNFNSFEIATKTGQNEFLVRKNLEKLKNVELNKILNLRLNLIEIDYRLKIGQIIDPKSAFELAFLGGNLC